ncbi:MAG: alpha/beta hydrolase [Weeksellaceae bacterium]|nr:alpha/beta hydrolase [Weeksellaceae bacterium]
MLAHTIYQHETSKEWVTFVHGAGGSSTIWFKQIREFRKHFNILILDLRGHGRSKNNLKSIFEKRYTFKSVSNDVVDVLDHLKIDKSHFVGVSLGTIIIRQIAEDYPERVTSMVMGGAVMKMNFRGQILMKIGNIFKNVFPYLFLYKIFAFAIMPKNAHKESRNLFINEAKKLYQKEFLKWFKLTSDVNPLLKWFRQVEINIPTFYIMGEEDYMFLPTIQKLVQQHYQSAQLYVVENSGHVVNVDQPQIFNEKVIEFIKKNL